MDWNGHHQLTRPFVPPQESSFNFLLHYNHDQFPGMEMKHVMQTQPQLAIPSSITDKKKRLSNDQLESLENSFQVEIKLDPDRKMKLAKELGLQPRQIAVWFQNRRARWKAKQLEHLYNALKQEFDVVCREKNKLQEEVVALREILKGGVTKKQISAGNTELSGGEETVESIALPSSSTTVRYRVPFSSQHQIVEGNCIFNVDEYNAIVKQHQQQQQHQQHQQPQPPPPYWSCFPACMPMMKDADDC